MSPYAVGCHPRGRRLNGQGKHLNISKPKIEQDMKMTVQIIIYIFILESHVVECSMVSFMHENCIS